MHFNFESAIKKTIECARKSRGSKVLGLLFPFLISISNAAHAFYSTDVDTRPDPKESPFVSQVDQVDPRSGALIVKHTDISIPGNGGMTINVNRMYNSLGMSAGLSATYMLSTNWTELGVGWKLGVAPRLSFNNLYFRNPSDGKYTYPTNPMAKLCGNQTFSGDLNRVSLQLELPDGSSEIVHSSGGYYGFTKTNWKVTCLSNVITVSSPDGINYDFGTLNDRKIAKYRLASLVSASPTSAPFTYAGTTTSYWIATKATDINGNWLSYTYLQFGTPITPWPIPNANGSGYAGLPADDAAAEKPATLISQITSSDGRTVNFNYNATTGRLETINDGAGNVWQYQYLTPTSTNSRTLSKVIRPDGSTWEYSYVSGAYVLSNGGINTILESGANISARRLRQIKYPTGGTVAYTYTYYNRSKAYSSNDARVTLYSRGEQITSRTLSSGKSWSYAYARGGTGNYDTTTITGPLGVETYKFMGAGYAIATSEPYPYTQFQNNIWRVGQLMEHTSPNGAKETYVWQPREILNYPDLLWELGAVHDQKIWAPDLQSKTVLRDGATYTTTYSNYDAYGNPGTIVEAGPNGGNRTTTLTYFNDASKWIIGKRKDESFAGSSTTRTFDANGNLTNITKDGVSTSYTYDAAGNVATATMPRGLVYTFSNYKRGIPQTEVQPESVTVTRLVDNAGNITSETNGAGKTTTYTYDGLNRFTSVTTPIGNPKTTVYTATH